jgi:hypothetical protein
MTNIAVQKLRVERRPFPAPEAVIFGVVFKRFLYSSCEVILALWGDLAFFAFILFSTLYNGGVC